MKHTLWSLLAMPLFAAPLPAQTFDVDFIGNGMSESFFEALSNEIMVTRTGSSWDTFEGLENTPLEGMTMRCFGAATILRGIVDGSGNCVLTDPDGFQVLQVWHVDEVAPGRSLGTWHFIGGTGPHESVKGRGHYEQDTNAIMGTESMRIVGVAKWPE